MRWLGRVLRFGDHAAVWRAVNPRQPPAGGLWFLGRFMGASSVVVRKWGPSWAIRHRILGYELGTWMFAVAWLGVPMAAAIRAVWRFIH
jgi:hypothetical protein